jgi:hypothetical protein
VVAVKAVAEMTLEELLEDACEVTREHMDRDAAESCCQQCGDEYDEAHPPSYDVPRCKHGTQTCSNKRHIA